MQIVSDLHLEFYDIFKPIIKPSAPILILAGDICVAGTDDINKLKLFFDNYQTKFKLIIWIAGNHEYYTYKNKPYTIDEINIKCKKLVSEYKNIVFLNNETIIVTINDKKYKIIGSTLWTNFLENEYKEAIFSLSDYDYIYQSDIKYTGYISSSCKKRIKPAYIDKLHIHSSEFIKNEINNSKYPTIIITHHKPFIDNNRILGYESDQISILTDSQKNKIKFWIYGHTHKSYNAINGGIHFISNPKGYPNQHTKFIDNLTLLC